MIKILIVDDHSIVRQGLRTVLGDSLGITVVAEAESGQEALDLAATMELDIVILDIGMQGRDGLEVLRELIARKPKLGVIIFSMYPEEQYAIRCFKDGAGAYISKNNPPEELIRAIHAIAEGRKYVTQPVAERMASLIQGKLPVALHEKLSDRELAVLVKIGSGMPLARIAEELFLSPKTVSAYKTRILKKMGMKNSASLIRYVLDEKLL